MAAMLNRRAYEHAKELITEGRFIFDERGAWSEHRPSAEEENEFIRLHSLTASGIWDSTTKNPRRPRGTTNFPMGISRMCTAVACSPRKAARANINIMTSRTRRRAAWDAGRPQGRIGCGALASSRRKTRPRDPTFGAMTGSPFQRFTIQQTRLSNRLTSKHVISGK
jgi:hypothetical protein